MKNVKDQVYAKLLEVSSNTTDSYPSDWVNFPTIQYVEDENRVYERTDDVEQKAYVRYVIDVWDSKSTSQAAMDVDAAISGLGLVRTSCKDIPEPNMKHKKMVYEGIIEMDSEIVYWNN